MKDLTPTLLIDPRSKITPYLVALIITFAVTLLWLQLDPGLSGDHPFLIYMLAVLLSAKFFGTLPALLAMGVSILLANFLFIGERFEFSPLDAEHQIGLAIFAFVSLAGIYLTDTQRRAVAFAQTQHQKLLDETDARYDAEQKAHRLAQLVENSDDAIIRIDKVGTITDWNAGATYLYGFTPEEAVGQSIRIIIPEVARHEFPVIMKQLCAGMSYGPRDVVRCHKDGTTFEVSLRISPLFANQEMIGAFSITRDMTYTKRLEKELFQIAKLEAIALLAGGIAHDFNNFLTSILGGCETILDRASECPEEVRLAAETIQQCGQRAARLTQQLLAYSRNQILTPQLVDINTVLRELEPIVRRLLGESINYQTNYENDGRWVEVDPVHFEQVAINMMLNARDAMPNGGRLTVTIHTSQLQSADLERHPTLQPGFYTCMEISDTGEGMSAETMSRVFEPFFTTKPPGKGTGLGLASVYGFIRQSKGFVEVESALGVGTTFRVWLPEFSAATTGNPGT